MFVLSLGRAMSAFILGLCELLPFQHAIQNSESFSTLAWKDEGFSVTKLLPVCPRKTLVHLRIHCDAKHGVRFEVFVCFGYPSIGWRLCTSGSPLDTWARWLTIYNYIWLYTTHANTTNATQIPAKCGHGLLRYLCDDGKEGDVHHNRHHHCLTVTFGTSLPWWL